MPHYLDEGRADNGAGVHHGVVWLVCEVNRHNTGKLECALVVVTRNQYMLAASLTVLVEEELVEAQAAGFLANEAVNVLRAVVVHGHRILERLDT